MPRMPASRYRVVTLSEASVHERVADFLRLQYRNVHFRTDFAAGIKMTLGQGARHKRLQSGRAWPDLFIAEPRSGQHGLFLELKKEGTRIFLKDGSLSTEKHIQEQAAVLEDLRARGYAAEFAVGFNEAVRLINEYLRKDAP